MHFIREAELKEHKLDSIMKYRNYLLRVKATTLILVAICVVKNADKLFSKQEPNNPEKVEPPKKEVFESPKNVFLQTLLQTRGAIGSFSPLQ